MSSDCFAFVFFVVCFFLSLIVSLLVWLIGGLGLVGLAWLCFVCSFGWLVVIAWLLLCFVASPCRIDFLPACCWLDFSLVANVVSFAKVPRQSPCHWYFPIIQLLFTYLFSFPTLSRKLCTLSAKVQGFHLPLSFTQNRSRRQDKAETLKGMDKEGRHTPGRDLRRYKIQAVLKELSRQSL